MGLGLGDLELGLSAFDALFLVAFRPTISQIEHGKRVP
jgi:hypothetical protein